MAEFDVVVCGLGAMGSATLYELARRGKRVLGLEQFAPGHDRGSSHGATRIIRLAYFEHPSYVPLLRRAYASWRELEQASGRKLLHITGILEIGSPQSVLVRGTLASARLHGLRHDVLAAAELMRRFPVFKVPADYVGVLQEDGGWIAIESAFAAWTALAREEGAQIRTGERVRAIEQRAGTVRIASDAGMIETPVAVLTAGAWTNQLVAGLPLRATRQVMAWFEAPPTCTDDCLPVFMLESRHGTHYGIPPERANASAGIKIARHHHRDETVDPDSCERTVSRADENLIRAALAEHLPAANGRLIGAKTCLYTMTPDGDFLIDRVAGAEQIIVASPCSGHGFKFAPVIGEILADLAGEGETRHDITRFRLTRFAHPWSPSPRSYGEREG